MKISVSRWDRKRMKEILSWFDPDKAKRMWSGNDQGVLYLTEKGNYVLDYDGTRAMYKTTEEAWAWLMENNYLSDVPARVLKNAEL